MILAVRGMGAIGDVVDDGLGLHLLMPPGITPGCGTRVKRPLGILYENHFYFVLDMNLARIAAWHWAIAYGFRDALWRPSGWAIVCSGDVPGDTERRGGKSTFSLSNLV